MMRLAAHSTHRCRAAALHLARRRVHAEEPFTSDGIKSLFASAEDAQARREKEVDKREVVFASAASADHRPRIAAAEAFDVAAAALPRAPNFCYANVSVDYAAMLDAPEVIWYNLCKASGIETGAAASPSAKAATPHMIGGAVCQQRLGGGYVQVVLGCVPDLESDAFTFDTVPEATALHDPNRPPPALCLATLDTKLALQYERVLNARLGALTQRLGPHCPLVGGLYPSIATEANGAAADELRDSLFFVNGRVYRGSAAAVVLRSRLLRAHAFSVVPSISVGHARLGGLSLEAETGTFVIAQLDSAPAASVVRGLYDLPELREKPCKVFLGVRHGEQQALVPLAFVAEPASGALRCIAPSDVVLRDGDTVEFLVDDAELDTETAAGLLISAEQKLEPVSVSKDVAIAREARRSVVASSVAALHFSYAGLNVVARPDVPVIHLGNAQTMFAPSVLQRCVGRTCPNSGIFCAGQVATVADVTAIFARSSTYCFLQGTS